MPYALPDVSTPARVGPPSIVMLLVIVTTPKPPESIALISPPAAVLLIAPAKVLHGAVRLHGFASSPTPETQVRVACAARGAAEAKSIVVARSLLVVLSIVHFNVTASPSAGRAYWFAHQLLGLGRSQGFPCIVLC
jgi:hypothetical protein